MHQVFSLRQDIPPHVHVPASHRARARVHAGEEAQVRRLRQVIQPPRGPRNSRQEVPHASGNNS